MGRRILTVALLSLLSISLWVPDLPRAFGHPHGVMNGVLDADGSFSASPKNGPKARDFLDLSKMPVPMRMRMLRNGGACWQPSPGDPCDLSFKRGGREYRVARPAFAEPPENAPVVLIRVILALLWLGASVTLVLLRPSVATWAFFVLSLYGWTPNNIFAERGPDMLQVVLSTYAQIWEDVLPFAAAVFALYLLQPGRLSGWRRIALVGTGAAAGVVALVDLSVFVLAAQGNGVLLPAFWRVLPFAGAAATWLATAFLLATYADSETQDRQRIRWVLAGFFLGSIALTIIPWANSISYVYYSVTQAAYVFFITASTVYAVLKHRIIDINVVLSRTLVYALLSALVVGLFALVDFFVSRTLTQSNAGLMADIALALVIGFFMNTMHHRLDRFVDGILFRKRHLAERHIALVAHALRHAEHENAVNKMLVDEPVRSFDLVFGALARRIEEDTFEVVYVNGDVAVGGRFTGAETLCAYLRSERKALMLRYHFWHADALRAGEVEPSIAVPVFSHGELDAIAFYAPHRNGTELDGDEIELIDRVADAAGAAFDRLEARALRERIELMPLLGAAGVEAMQ